MPLPKTSQMVAQHAFIRGLTRAQVAEGVGLPLSHYTDHAKGRRYVGPDEAKAYEKFFGLPIQVLFDEKALTFLDGPWPPPRGMAAAKAVQAKKFMSDATSTGYAAEPTSFLVDVPGHATLVAVPDEYVDRVVAFLRGLDTHDARAGKRAALSSEERPHR